MNLVSVVDAIHWGFAFLVILCALVLGWVQLGRRVMVALIGVQVLIGVVYAGIVGAALAGKTALISLHIVGALVATAAYVAGRRLGERTGVSAAIPVALSALGLLVLLGTGYIGLVMFGRISAFH